MNRTRGSNLRIDNSGGACRRVGFTLIELLVVISIIGLLVAFLMPSLSEARRWSRIVTCQSNLRQQGYMYGMYATDCRDYLPAPGSPHRWALWDANNTTGFGSTATNLGMNFTNTIAFISTTGGGCPRGNNYISPHVTGWFYWMQYIPTVVNLPGSPTSAQRAAVSIAPFECPDAPTYDAGGARFRSRAASMQGSYNAYTLYSQWFASQVTLSGSNPTGVGAQDCTGANVWTSYTPRGWYLNLAASTSFRTALRARSTDWGSNKGVLVDTEFQSSANGGWQDPHNNGLNMLRADGSAIYTGKDLPGKNGYPVAPAVYYSELWGQADGSQNGTNSAWPYPITVASASRLWNYYETGNP